MYLIPGCYMGNVQPTAAMLRPGCDISKLTTITPMLSPKFKGEFEKAQQDILPSIEQAKVESKGQVLTSAVASVDPDSAQVLVVADAQVKSVFDTRARHFRWEISLVKLDGKWLVDDFSPVD